MRQVAASAAATECGGLRHAADRTEGPALPHRRGVARRHRSLRSVLAHGSGARAGRLQRDARPWRLVRAHRRGRPIPDWRRAGATRGGSLLDAATCIISHGLQSSPDATKATALSRCRASPGLEPRASRLSAISMPRISEFGDVPARIATAAGNWRAAVDGPLVLAGSSMGAFISARVSLEVPVRGLFLMAPPTRLQRHDISLEAAPVPTCIVHGWHDELIPALAVVQLGASAKRPPGAGRRQPSAGGARRAVRRGIRPLPEGTGVKFFVACAQGPGIPAGRRTACAGRDAGHGRHRRRQRRGRRQRRLPRGDVLAAGQSRAVAARGIRLRERTGPVPGRACAGLVRPCGAGRHPRGGCACVRPTLTHERYAAQRVKDAVVDRIRASHGVRPSVDVDAPDLRMNFVLRKGRGFLSIDLGGGALHRRGWRQSQGEAPLKENLAAAMLMRGGWPKIHARRRRVARSDVRQRHPADRRRADGRGRGARPVALAGQSRRARWLRFRQQRAGRRCSRKREQRAAVRTCRPAACVLRRRHRSECAACGAGQCRSGRARRI